MAFRADEAAISGLAEAKNYLIPRGVTPPDRTKLDEKLSDIVDQYGPVIQSYPSWHPLVSKHDLRHPETVPSERCGYIGLDHTVTLAHGFITCPYVSAERILDSVSGLTHHCADITAEVLDVEFYNSGTVPVLVRCDWHETLEEGNLIPKRLAVPLMMEQELPGWRWAERAERWETMRPYILGLPHGSRSSLFVGQETALALKRAYLSMVESGMYGPLKI